MSEITAIWERIEAWYEKQGASHLLNAGASEEAIADAEKQIGVEFPRELRESLMRHNGTGGEQNWSGWPNGALLNVEGIVNETSTWRQLTGDGVFDEHREFDGSLGSQKIKLGWWNDGWIHIDADGAGNSTVIDMNPGPEGSVGQVIDMDHEVGPNGPNNKSFVDYLRELADDFEKGEYIFAEDDIHEAIDREYGLI